MLDQKIKIWKKFKKKNFQISKFKSIKIFLIKNFLKTFHSIYSKYNST